MSTSEAWTLHPDPPPIAAMKHPSFLIHRALESAGDESLERLLGGSEGEVAMSRGYRQRSARTFSVIDLGSNTARLVIYHSAPVGPPWSVFEAKDNPRLSSDPLPDGRIGEAGRRRGLSTMARFRKMLDAEEVRTVRAVATSAVRDAPNRSAFAGEVARRCGFRLRILTAAEEARFGYLGVATSLPLDDDLLLDLGGGSLQLMTVRSSSLRESLSLPLGALRLHYRFLRHDPPKRKELEELEEHVDKALRVMDGLESVKGERVIGVGGTTRALAHVLQAARSYPLARVHGYEMRVRDLERLYEILSQSSVGVRREMPGLSTDRADIVVAGLAVVLAVLHHREVDGITVSGCGIREGLAQEVLGRSVPTNAEEMARGSALATLWAYGLDVEHARRVRSLAVALYDMTRRAHEMEREERLALEVAALLHDMGSAVAYPGHAAHSAYMMLNRPLYGLTHRGFLIASLAVGMHEGDDISGGMIRRFAAILHDEDLEVIRRLAAMLAMAESVADMRPRPRFRVWGDQLVVSLPGGVAFHPRLFERASRWMRRSLDLEVRLRGS